MVVVKKEVKDVEVKYVYLMKCASFHVFEVTLSDNMLLYNFYMGIYMVEHLNVFLYESLMNLVLKTFYRNH